MQGIVYFNGLVYLGGEMTFSRGVSPSVCTLRSLPGTSFDRQTGTLQFVFGGNAVTFPDCAVLENTFRPFHGRDGWRWTIQVVDRRWKWRYYYIDGVYNERAADGTIQTGNKKNAKELVELCLDAMGETGYDTTAVSTDVYPPVRWNRARAAHELQWLCDLLGLVVVLRLDNKVGIYKLNDAAGANVPLAPIHTPLGWQWKSAVMPETLIVQGNPSVIQSKLLLEAVGLDDDGKILPIDELSYTPASGWEAEWPTVFYGVADEFKHLAFASVFRWYRPISGWDGDGVDIDDYSQLELLTHLAECGEDSDGVFRPLKPVILGEFWPNSCHPINTPADTTYTGAFKVKPDIGIVEFEYPILSWSGTDVMPAVVELITAYRVREPDSDGYSCYKKDKAVDESVASTGDRILHHPELTKVKVVDSVYGAAGDNELDLDAEADEYLDATAATYAFTASTDVMYNGVLPFNLDGAISQVKWNVGNGVKALTRIGRNTEFDIYTAHHQQRRAMERLAQMAERIPL